MLEPCSVQLIFLGEFVDLLKHLLVVRARKAALRRVLILQSLFDGVVLRGGRRGCLLVVVHYARVQDVILLLRVGLELLLLARRKVLLNVLLLLEDTAAVVRVLVV